MNKWVKKSIDLVKSTSYLDKLLEIYPPEEISRKKTVEEETSTLKQFFKEKNCINLIKELLRLKKLGFKFPIENPYISFLSHCEEAIDKNPITIKKICEKLFNMTYEELKAKLETPKKPSRRMGPMFKTWLKNKFRFLDSDNFIKVNNLSFLNGGDNFLKEFAIKELKCKFKELSKGLDFIAKTNKIYIIGTAKFITDFGGSQDNQFKEAISLIKETYSPKNVIKIAIIDGVSWLSGKMKITLEKLKDDELCFSALLLEKFLKTF